MPEWRDAAAVDFAVRHEFAKEAVVPERKLLTTALKQGLGSVTVEGVRREYGRAPLLVEEHGGRRVATTGRCWQKRSGWLTLPATAGARAGRWRLTGPFSATG